MAQNLQLLKRRIRTSKNIAQIAKALEMIAASKIKKAQGASQNNKPYADRITGVITDILLSLNNPTYKHKYLDPKMQEGTTLSGKKLLIAISPDRGLCGSLNTNIYKKLIELDSKDIKIVTVGKKVGLFSSKLSFELLSSYPMGSTLPDYSLVYQLKTIIDEQLDAGEISSVHILYADFVSLFTQTPTVKQLLPLQFTDQPIVTSENGTLFEPGKEVLLDALLPYYLEVQLYNSLLQAFTSEQAAQMVAMQNAKNNAFDIAEYLNLVYNKSRQERITNEILDLANSTQI
ncbi:MAG: ATP synthase F1 subunit gamma [Candidatus Levybacteria bacterium]|nr:ATP synthase F1 subunit gamma [Candidatus Levybacteria bacterium]